MIAVTRVTRKAEGHRTKKATVNEALKEYVQRRKQLKILDLFGQIDYDQDYDYKEQRRRVGVFRSAGSEDRL